MTGRIYPPRPARPAVSGPPKSEHDLPDPANGEVVPRCLTCGMPARPKIALMEFELLLLPGRRRAGRYRLCERCHGAANGPLPLDPDPLDVTDAA